LYIGTLGFRVAVCLDEDSRVRFDKLYEVVLSALLSARRTAEELTELWRRHSTDAASGKVASLRHGITRVTESIDKELRAGIESVANASVRALKHGMQQLLAEFQVDVGFLFQRQGQFEHG